ncbi:unnamed protein product [Diplocarpon coronariae]
MALTHGIIDGTKRHVPFQEYFDNFTAAQSSQTTASQACPFSGLPYRESLGAQIKHRSQYSPSPRSQDPHAVLRSNGPAPLAPGSSEQL